MKIKNLKCYALGAVILVNSSFMMSCDTISSKYDRITNKDFYQFLEDNNISPIEELENIPVNYYMATVSEHNKISDNDIRITEHYEKLDRIDNVMCQAREYDYDYKVLKINEENGQYVVYEKVVDNIDDSPLDYQYVYNDDYVIENGYRDVLINYGKVLRRE